MTDGHPTHSAAIGLTFGRDIDWAILEKKYATAIEGERRYSPPVCTGMRVRLQGSPDPERISRQTPAMAAGVVDHIWTLREIAALLDSNLPITNGAKPFTSCISSPRSPIAARG
jgi:hypothetical protein